MKWPTQRFGDLYSIPSRNGMSRPSRVRGEGYKMVNMGELFAHDRIGDIPMELVPMNQKELEQSSLCAGDLLFARQSLVLEGAGKCSIVTAVPEITTFESHLIRVRLSNEKSDPRFYYYLFSSPYSGMSTIVQQCAQAGIRASSLAELKVLAPPLETQERIADTLTAYDDLMENNRRRMALLEESARLLYQEWFVRLRFPGHEHTRLVDGVPVGWERKTLGDVCTDIRDTVSPDEVEPDSPYIGLEHIPRRSISLTDWGKADAVTSTKHRYIEGDILFGKIRPYFHKVGISFTDGVASSDAIVIRPFDHTMRALVLMTTSSDEFVAEASQTAREGSKMPRADWKLMLKFPFAVPPSVLLTDFSESISDITSQLRNLCFQNQKLRTARDLLLPRLMSGEIKV